MKNLNDALAEAQRTYQGQRQLEVSKSPYADYKPADWALYFLDRWGSIDGDHHKAWVIDQVKRILMGNEVEVHLATWGENGIVTEHEYRVMLKDEPTEQYKTYVAETIAAGYSVDEGIAP